MQTNRTIPGAKILIFAYLRNLRQKGKNRKKTVLNMSHVVKIDTSRQLSKFPFRKMFSFHYTVIFNIFNELKVEASNRCHFVFARIQSNFRCASKQPLYLIGKKSNYVIRLFEMQGRNKVFHFRFAAIFASCAVFGLG